MAKAHSVAPPFIELQQVESTNNYATGLVHAGMAQHGTAVFAHHQTAGKGQQGRQWLGEEKSNIALSLILQPPPLLLSQSFVLSMATAVGVQRFFTLYAGHETSVKWPNDIYWRDRKAGGILIENMVQGSDWKAAVIGIGLNVNQTNFANLRHRAVSLRQITGQLFSPLELAKELCTVLSQVFEELLKDSGQVREEYRLHLYKRNQSVRLKKGSRVFEAVIRDVTTTGELIIEHATEERFAVGEVEWILP